MIALPKDVIERIRDVAAMANTPGASLTQVETTFPIEDFARYAERMGRADPDQPYIGSFRRALPHLNAARVARDSGDLPGLARSLKAASAEFDDVD
jgi:hypothetical protein